MSGESKKIIVTAIVLLIVIGGGSAFFYWYTYYRTRPGVYYVTYFDRSVSGLVEESPVTYKGVSIGEIDKMGIAPDGKLVEVVFKVYDSDFKVLETKTVTCLEPFGYTGLFVIGLEERKPDDIDKSPEIAFPTEYPVIASTTRGIPTRTQILDINEKVDKILKHLEVKSGNDTQ